MLSLLLLFAISSIAQDAGRGVEPPPDFKPSYEVHIWPSGSAQTAPSVTQSGNYWVARGWDLKNVIAETWHVDGDRIEMPESLNNGKHYDLAMVLPQAEDRQTIYGYVRQAVQNQFHLRIHTEPRTKDVYLLTVPNGLSPAAKLAPPASNRDVDSTLRVTDDSVSALGASMDDFCHVLERLLGRMVIDETKLDQRFDIEVRGDGHGRQALISMLRDRLGMVLTPEIRTVEMLVVQSEGSAGPQ
ncbi:MAG TPA: TIGR03435 family protein [Bryobacteraceae bacterium]|nr:TIGR03435 family protein [Bryobacteraceae bacterium]